MGHMKHRLEDALAKLHEIRDPNECETDEEKERNANLYNEVYRILDEHISHELEEEKEVGDLIRALSSYRKHLKFARMILDKDFSCTNEEEGEITLNDQDSCKGPDYRKDILYARHQLEYAIKELGSIKALMKRLLEEEKLHLE